ncbi:MAG: winged helix DNA-binding domain-containing protein [Anaerolineae bacterium]|nr:winged helix DNA-binding domain-containing protein [Anaerolineae bacterium]
MAFLPRTALDAHRAFTYRLTPGTGPASPDEAVNWINERGFVLFWPHKGLEFPSLWTSVAGNRPVPDEHDDPGHVTWGWKDGLLGQRRVYYGRLLKKRNTFASLTMLPYFYALSPNYGSPEEDYLIDYEAGRLTAEARAVYETLLDQGPMDSVALRKAARLAGKNSDAPFNRALEELQTTLRILPVGIAEAGAWRYAFVFDLVTRHYPDLVERAHPISEWEARRELLLSALRTQGAARQVELQRLLSWTPDLTEKAVSRLAESGRLVRGVAVEGEKGTFLTLPELAGDETARSEFIE